MSARQCSTANREDNRVTCTAGNNTSRLHLSPKTKLSAFCTGRWPSTEQSTSRVVSVDSELADDYEIMFIDIYNTQVTSGGVGCRGVTYTKEMRLNMSKSKRPLSDVPMNIYHLRTKCSEGYTVNQYGHHRATFTSSKYSMEEKLEQAKAYLATMPKEKPKRELPKYVGRYQGGLLVYLKQTASRPKVWKAFKTGTHAEQLAAVQEFLETLKQKGVIE